MSANTPPSPYFSGINFNPSFFIGAISAYLTEAIANTKYLLLSGANFMTGNLGIGRAPAVELDVDGQVYINNNFYSSVPSVGTYGGNSTRIIMSPGTASEYPLAIGVSNTAVWYGTQTAGSHIFYTGATERLIIKSDGNVGIGTNNPVSKLHLHNNATSQNVYLRLTDNTSGATATDGIAIQKTDLNDLFLIAYESARMYFFTANTPRLVIQANGNVGIVPTGGNPDGTANIFQVGNGGRLRISNGTTDYTLIGSKETDDSNNTRIVIWGYQNGTANIGSLEYVATASGTHKFYTGGTAERIRISSAGDLLIGPVAGTVPNIQLGTTDNNIAIPSGAGNFSASAAAGDMVIRSVGKMILQSGSGNSAIMVNTNNYINIGSGNTVGTYPITLRTNLSGFLASLTVPYATASGTAYIAQSTPTSPNIQIGIVGETLFTTGFYISSDKRIKKDIEPIDNSLELLNKINLVSYKYIDYIEKGNIKNYGVIAQEVEEIIPEVINKSKDYIPNIYKNIDSYDKDLLKLYIKYDDKFDLTINDKIKIYDDKNNEFIKTIIEIDEDSLTIDSPIENYEDETPLFIYGKEVAELKNVNYEALFIINMKATQELYKRLEKLEKYFNVLY